MNIKKIHFEIDKTIEDSTLQKVILRKYENHKAKHSDVIVVIGGDGFMLKTLYLKRAILS